MPDGVERANRPSRATGTRQDLGYPQDRSSPTPQQLDLNQKPALFTQERGIVMVKGIRGIRRLTRSHDS